MPFTMVTVRVVLPDAGPWSASNNVNMTLDTFRMLVFGDSITWGQGVQASPGSAATRAAAPKHAVSSPLFTTGSPEWFDTLDLKEAKTLFDWARVSASLERSDGPVAG
jgi:hypothetical protein